MNLYTRTKGGTEESDDCDQWFAEKFENPAAAPIQKAISGSRMQPPDWYCLIRFLGAQIVRTPAYFIRNKPFWEKSAPEQLTAVLEEYLSQLENSNHHFNKISPESSSFKAPIPVRINRHIEDGSDFGTVSLTTVVGREFWMANMKSLLDGEATRILHQHHWTILEAASGSSWFTSDDPVILLNAFGFREYDFRGGTNASGTSIMLPLSPKHLLFTKVGRRPPKRGTVLRASSTDFFRKIIAEHAHRYIYANSPEEEVPTLRPRSISESQFRSEQSQWAKWHEDQMLTEKELFG